MRHLAFGSSALRPSLHCSGDYRQLSRAIPYLPIGNIPVNAGSTAHVFDSLGPKLAAHYHVVGITRRGFGQSSAPQTGFDARRLGDDVVAVLDALHIADPVLVGHSIAGEELSAISTYHPGRAAALIYLDAGGTFALYNPKQGDYTPALAQLRDDLSALQKNLYDDGLISKTLTDMALLFCERSCLIVVVSILVC